MEERRLTAVFVILMLMVSVCPGFASANPIADERGIDIEHGERTNSVELLKASLNKREPVTITLGGPPSSKGGQNASYSDLENFKTATWDRIQERYLYPNGSVIGFGYDVDGYLRVGLWNGPPPPENVSSVDSLHTMLDERAKSMGIENIPVQFTVFISPPELVLDGDRLNPPERTGPDAQSPENSPAEVTSLDALTVALHEPGGHQVAGEREYRGDHVLKRNLSEGGNDTQVVFRPEDSDPGDCMTAPRSWSLVNDS
jgi:hypothetical protein